MVKESVYFIEVSTRDFGKRSFSYQRFVRGVRTGGGSRELPRFLALLASVERSSGGRKQGEQNDSE